MAGSPGSADGTGSAARFNGPRGISVDTTGNLYVADSNNHVIRKIAPGGVVTTLAGTAASSGFKDATGSAARFFNPRGIAVDSSGTIYVADTNNQRIRQIAADGIVTTFAGSGLAGSASTQLSAAARFNNPEGVTVDAAGVVYVADTTNDGIRKIANGIVSDIAGYTVSPGSGDGLEQTAHFAYPTAVAIDLHTSLWCLPVGGLRVNSLYVADRNNNTIREITLTGVETTSGRVSTLAGSADHPGNADGPVSAARFNSPRAVAVDNSICGTNDHVGAVYVADGGNHTVRMIRNGVVTTLAGLAESPGWIDGTGSDARFNQPSGIAVDNATGALYVADTSNHTIRKIESGGIVTTIAGLAGTSGSTDGVGSAARFNSPTGLAVDAAGVVYVADTNNHTIRRMTAAGVVTTVAGLAGARGANDGSGAVARFNSPQGIALDRAGSTIYVADTDNQTIRRIAAGNEVTTIAGRALSFGSENDGRFNTPEGIAVDSRGFLYVADTRNNQIQTTRPLDTSLLVDVGPGYGIWIRRGSTWRQVHPRSAKALMVIDTGSDDSLIVDFGPGVGIWFYHWDGNDLPSSPSWVQIHSLSADAMAGIDSDGDVDMDSVAFSFAGAGLWLFNRDANAWSQLHRMNPIHLAACNLDGADGDELIADFAGYGLWIYSAGAWSQLHGLDVSTMMTADLDGNGKEDLIATFPGFGVWAYMNRTSWVQIHGLPAQRTATADLDGNGVTDLIIDFGQGVGVWARMNGTTWEQLHGLTTESIVGGDLDGDGLEEVIADFGAAGVWSFQEDRGWEFVHGLNPKSVVTGRLR